MRTGFMLVTLLFAAACGSKQHQDTEPTAGTENTTPMMDAAIADAEPSGQPMSPTSEIGTGAPPTTIAERAGEPEPATTPPGGPEARPTLDDGAIAGVLAKANELEVAAGKLAATRAQDPRVKKLAAHMVHDHAKTDAEAQKLFEGHGITAAASDDSRRLDEDGQATIGKLSALTGSQFDQAYVDSQVAMHEDVIEKLDRELMPSAKNASLRAFLTKIRPALATHLEDARTLQRKLAGP